MYKVKCIFFIHVSNVNIYVLKKKKMCYNKLKIIFLLYYNHYNIDRLKICFDRLKIFQTNLN